MTMKPITFTTTVVRGRSHLLGNVQFAASRLVHSTKIRHGLCADPRVCHKIAATSNSTSSSDAGEGGKYAFLHDFCMAIPYGLIIVAAGIVVALLGPPAAGVLLTTSGAGVLACASISLKRWKVGQGSAVSTGVIALIAAYHSWLWGMKFKIMMVKGKALSCIFSAPFALFILSTMMALFAMYNIAAGGNPPKKPKTA